MFASTTAIAGTLNSATNTTFRVELFDNDARDPSGYGEGQTFLAALDATTDGSGNASFTFTNPTSLPLTHYVSATATDPDGNTSEFSFARRVVTPDSVDLAVTKSVSGSPVPRSTNFSYTITVTNFGPTNASSVLLTDPLPSGLAFVSASTTQGTVTNAAGVILASIGSLANGAGATVQIFANGTETGFVTNTATASANESENDPDNNIASVETFIGVADLSVRITDSPDPVAAGQTVTYTIVSSNAGPDTATSVTLGYTVDSDFYATSGSLSQGTFAQSGNYFDCQIGTLAVGGTATLTVTAIPLAVGSFNNHHAENYRAESDPAILNNFANEQTTVTNGPGILEFTMDFQPVSESIANALFTVQRLGGAVGTVTVNFATSNLTATAGSDYTATNGTLTFTNGELFKTISVAITGDTAPECNESLRVSLSSPGGGAIILRNTNTMLFIFDDDLTLVGTISGVSLALTNMITTGNNYSHQPSISADGSRVAYRSYATDLARQPGVNYSYYPDIYLHDRSGGTNQLVSLNTNGVASSGYFVDPVISADGQRVAFLSSATDLTPNVTNFYQNLFVRTPASNSTVLVSVNTNGTGGSSHSYDGSLSADGGKIAFYGYANDLVANDANGNSDVFFRDLAAGTNVLVSVNLGGTGSANGYSYSPAISADGNYVAFASYANNVTATDGNTRPDIFRRNLAAGTTALVSANNGGNAGNNYSGDNVFISADGRYVAFESYSTDLVPGGTPSFTREIFRRDMTGGTNQCVSLNNSNVAANGYCTLQGLSADGRYALFFTDASNLAGSDTNNSSDIFVRDIVAGTTLLVSADLSGTNTGNGYATYCALSAGGRYVSFVSQATDLVATSKQPNIADVFVRDLVGGVTTLLTTQFGGTNGGNGNAQFSVISSNGVVAFATDASDLVASDANFGEDVFARAPGGPLELLSASGSATGNGYSGSCRLTPDGTRVVFANGSGNLVTNDNNGTSDVFLRNLTNGVTTLLSVNATGTGPGNSFSENPRPSADARFVAFSGAASDLVSGDLNADTDIFLRDTVAGTTLLVSVKHTGSGSGNGASEEPEITPDGQFVVFQSYAGNLTTNDSNGTTFADVFIRNRTNAVAELISVTPSGAASGNGASYNPVVSDNGRYVAFESVAGNLGPADSNNEYDVYVRDRTTGSNILCSANLAGATGNSGSSAALITPDGRYVAYLSYASDLATGDTNGMADIFVFDVLTRTNRLVSVNLAGTGTGDNYSGGHSISADGRYVAFESYATNLVANDSNGSYLDIFVRDLVANTTTLVSVNCAGTGSGDNYSYSPQISADGRYVTFYSFAWNLVPGHYPPNGGQTFRRDLQTGETILVSHDLAATGGGDSDSYAPLISSTGNTIAFISSATDLIADDLNNNYDFFIWNSGEAAPAAVNLFLAKTASAGTLVEFSPLTYTLRVTNLGTLAASATVVTDALPASLSFISATTSTGTVTNLAGLVTANLGALGIGASATITITAMPTNSGIITNLASTTAPETDSAPANNNSAAIVTVTAFPAPPLYAQRTNANLLLLWPSNTPSVFALESKTNLQPAVTWSPVTNSVGLLGTNNSVTLTPDLSERTRFFRLRR